MKRKSFSMDDVERFVIMEDDEQALSALDELQALLQEMPEYDVKKRREFLSGFLWMVTLLKDNFDVVDRTIELAYKRTGQLVDLMDYDLKARWCTVRQLMNGE